MVGSIGKMVADSLLMRHCEIKLTTEQMFDIITLGSLPGVIIILLNRPINIYPGIGGVNDNGT